MKSALVRGTVVLALLMLGLVAGSQTAQAAPAPDRAAAGTSESASLPTATTNDTTCAGGDLCFWVNTNKGGAKGRVSGNNTSWSWAQASCSNGTWNNCASSIQNNGNSCTVFVYSNSGYTGSELEIRRGTYLAALTGYWITFPTRSWNDEIQSNKWCSRP